MVQGLLKDTWRAVGRAQPFALEGFLVMCRAAGMPCRWLALVQQEATEETETSAPLSAPFFPVHELLSQVRAREHQPRDTISDSLLVEVDDQSQGHVEQLHVTEKLGLVNGLNLFNGLALNKNAALHEHVKA